MVLDLSIHFYDVPAKLVCVECRGRGSTVCVCYGTVVGFRMVGTAKRSMVPYLRASRLTKAKTNLRDQILAPNVGSKK
jgi:hypothetical protein